jgi:2,4-dienoyl-CoA reductase [(3E)-enoyl-CoA-producing], peroxisomal
VAKAGVDALSAQLAIELGPRGITSNVIAPGVIGGTEGERRLYKDGKDEVKSTVPAGRLGTVKDVNNATVFLLSEAGDYINGTVQIGE